MEAAKVGSLQLVGLILKKGGNPNAVDVKRRSAVHYAAMGGFMEVWCLPIQRLKCFVSVAKIELRFDHGVVITSCLRMLFSIVPERWSWMEDSVMNNLSGFFCLPGDFGTVCILSRHEPDRCRELQPPALRRCRGQSQLLQIPGTERYRYQVFEKRNKKS